MYPLMSLSQDEKKINNIKIGIDLGIGGFSGDLKLLENIREVPSNYSFGLPHVENISKTYAGLKTEFFTWHNRLGFAAGLHFSDYSSRLSQQKYDYFFWLVGQDGLTTDYARIREINQHNYYISIPLEVRIFTQRKERMVQPYFKAGINFNYRIYTNNDIVFQSSSMNRYSDMINEQLMDNIDNFHVNAYFAAGLKIGRKPWFNIELQTPGGIIGNSNVSSFIKSSWASFAFQLSVQIPIGKNVPIGSN
jgi:hypothetical protein